MAPFLLSVYFSNSLVATIAEKLPSCHEGEKIPKNKNEKELIEIGATIENR